MKETSGDSYKQINEQLYEHGSWLYREEGRKWSFGMFFDPDTEEFKEFPNAYKMLVLKELFQSGITPAMLDASYKANCKETHLDKPYQDYGLLLLEHSLLHPEFKVVGNGNPLLDQEDYNLLDALVGQANV